MQRCIILDKDGWQIIPWDDAAQVGGAGVGDGFGVEVMDDAGQAGYEILAEDVLTDGDEDGAAKLLAEKDEGNGDGDVGGRENGLNRDGGVLHA